jgi:YD repeat-containing protein
MVSKVENYILQTPISIESKIIEQRFEYNETTRLLAKKTHMPNTDLALENTYFYNVFGNLVSVVDKDIKTQEQRQKYFNFDQNGLNIIASVNEMGHKRTFTFDLQDNLLLANDSNSLTTYYAYNSKGVKIYESKPGTSNISFVYAWDASAPNSVYSITSQADSGNKKKTIYDGLNRVIRTVSYGFNSEQIFEDTIYNSNGQIRQKSMPYKAFVSEGYLVTFEYDELLREIKRIEPGKAKNHSNYFYTQYVGLNVLKQDTLGNTRIETKNILGQIVSVQDTLGTSAFYSYDPLNNLVKIVDPHGATTVLKYNINNKLIYKDDPYVGVNEHTYNAFGELLSTKYANGQSVFYFRDALGRLITHYEYGSGKTSSKERSEIKSKLATYQIRDVTHAKLLLASLEKFYELVHLDLIRFRAANHLYEGVNYVRSNAVFETSLMPVGIDYNQGANALWSATDRKWHIIDF